MCFSPIWVRKNSQQVPCGKCYECVKRRRNDWYVRCLIESRARRYTYFGLLTYEKVGQTLDKRDVQLFLKRLRSYGFSFSYLIAGEYGQNATKRAHWHCLFFADSSIHFSFIARAWRGGRESSSDNVAGWIRFEPIRSARSIRYTVKYLYKYDGTNAKFELMMSRNPAIGHAFLVNQKLFLERKDASFSIDGRKMAMPRYFKRRFFEDYPDIKEQVNSVLADKVAEMAIEELTYAHSLYPNLSLHELKYEILKNKKRYNEHFRKLENCS